MSNGCETWKNTIQENIHLMSTLPVTPTSRAPDSTPALFSAVEALRDWWLLAKRTAISSSPARQGSVSVSLSKPSLLCP